jgi:hypothetical protein
MGVLMEQPDSVHFSSLPHICTANKLFSVKKAQNLISQLGQIFVEHDVHHEFGLGLVHRHFGMADNEILVETLTLDKRMSVAFPWKIDGK